jgi:glutaminyl-peptide cyclotransferase
MKYLCRIFALLLTFFFCTGAEPATAGRQQGSSFHLLKTTKATISKINIVNIFPHDPESFTEGLVYYKGYLYESTGLNGKSFLKKIEIKSGKIIKEIKLNEEYFGEGMAILDNKIYQLTYKNKIGFVYDLKNFKETGKFSYQGEGWGLTTDGKILFMSDGSPEISCIDPATFAVIRKIKVSDEKIPVNNLNELEFIRGEIWANIFLGDIIARISPQTGDVLGWIDLSELSLLLPAVQRGDVLNGIAYDSENDRIFVTGKYWHRLFEIKVQNQKQQ